jgi:hypothetical protein
MNPGWAFFYGIIVGLMVGMVIGKMILVSI